MPQTDKATTETDSHASVAVSPGGLPGEVRFTDTGTEFRGVWVSHTGFKHDVGTPAPAVTERYKVAAEMAEALYHTNKAYPFCVGAEGRSFGWKDITEDWRTGAKQIRLPSWHKGVVAGALATLGVELTDEHNLYFTFPVGSSKDDVLAVTAPLRREGTRFADEDTLAREVLAAANKCGFGAQAEQMDLF